MNWTTHCALAGVVASALAGGAAAGDAPGPLPNERQHFAAPPIVGREDEFCRRAYRVMLRGAAFCKDLYREWPTEPDCGYLGWGGHSEKEIDANLQMAHLYAILTHFGPYDERTTGVSREEALRRVKGVIRYCCFTHSSGPHVCTSGKHWGGGWHDASWSTFLAHPVWISWPELDEPTREMATRVIAAEADRFLDVDPPSGKTDNTQAESNAWNTRALAVAAVMFPTHPRAGAWREAYQRWAMNSLSIAADRQDDTLIDGRPVREWVTTENVHADFTLENHGSVYPVYMWATINGLCHSAGYYVLAGQKPPEAAYHHLRDMYDVYKRLQTWEGLPAYVNGSDKFLHLQVVDIAIHSFFAQVFGDREAAHLEQVELDILEKMQARFTDGRLYPVEEVGPWSRVGNLGGSLGTSYLLHYVCQANVEPSGWEALERRISGASYFPEGKFLLHRTPEKLVSFAWSKPHRVMGLVLPREGSWLVTPHVHGLTGMLREQGKRADNRIKIEDLKMDVRKNAFTITVTALRCGGRVEHRWTLDSPPGPEATFQHKMVARQPVTLEHVETGTIGIGRELGTDQVTVHSPEGTWTLGGLADAVDKTLEFPGGRATVGRRLECAWRGTGTLCYFKRSQPARVHGAPGGYGRIEDRLAIRHVEGPQTFAPGQTIAEGTLHIRMLWPQ